VSIDITAEVAIHRALRDVAAYMIDPAHDPEWIGGVREARMETPPPLAVGSRVARVAHFLGRRVEYVNEVVELDPERVLDMRSVRAPFPMRVTYSFEAGADAAAGGAGATTVVRNRVRGAPGGFFALFGPLLAPLVKRSVQKDLERLRDVLEAH
jgi:Polyketide cyclase / dehydrase and lipid transport